MSVKQGQTVNAAQSTPIIVKIADSNTISSSSAIYYNALLEVANPDGALRIGMTVEVAAATSSSARMGPPPMF